MCIRDSANIVPLGLPITVSPEHPSTVKMSRTLSVILNLSSLVALNVTPVELPDPENETLSVTELAPILTI